MMPDGHEDVHTSILQTSYRLLCLLFKLYFMLVERFGIYYDFYAFWREPAETREQNIHSSHCQEWTLDKDTAPRTFQVALKGIIKIVLIV